MSGLNQLIEVVDRLLGPGGCPWDQEQTHQSLKKHLVEEVYELFDAIDSGSDAALREELGDVLLQPIMHAQMEKLAGNWDIQDVATQIAEKLIRRHPHVFGDTSVESTEDVLKNWDKIKASESSEKKSILDGIPRSMPALGRAQAISQRAARSGFEWLDLDGVFDKLDEEVGELRTAIALGNPDEIEDEVGDLLFTAVNIARWNKVDPEEALRKMLDRFSGRFAAMEASATVPLGELNPAEWDRLWNQAKEKSQ
ncbi:MAG: nucleoside triphosphate pyrophosphohydrolase [Armatimonadetes bacterium]|nr:nucleoside triphosphate pyrophosphohydrolase [Armatimonadota bacterium]